MNLSFQSFQPHPCLRGSLLQTLAPTLLAPPHAKTRENPSPFSSRVHEVALPDGDTLVLLEDDPLPASARGAHVSFAAPPSIVYLLAPGLASHAGAPNLVRLARTLARRGVKAWRLNHRGTGEGRGRARGIYHAGRTDDLLAAVRHVARHEGPGARIVLVGYSLSGNMALLLAGREAARLPPQLVGIVAASPVLDLAANAPLIRKAALGFYDRLFLRDLRRSVAERHAAFPELGTAPPTLGASLWEFDALYTARQAGFLHREHYYAECSSLPWLAHIRIPAHVIASRDDPFSQADPRHLPDTVSTTWTDAGGHHGFFAARPCPHGDRFWLDGEVMRVAEDF